MNPQANDLRSVLAGLVAKWRAEADEISANNWLCNSNSIRARADELEAALLHGGGGEAVGRFGHHPDPATDFEIEVQWLEGRLFDAKNGIGKPGTEPESVESVAFAIERAMTFKVGGSETSVSAKQTLRALERDANRARRRMLAKAAATTQPRGDMVLVPREPTPEMLRAATIYIYGPGGPNYDHAGRWKAMLAAAPGEGSGE